MTKKFIAWVPTVTGRLSFSHISPKDRHKRNGGYNFTHSGGVDLLCIDTRNSSDTSKIFGDRVRRLIDKRAGKQGDYVFLAIGHSDPDFECLKGDVFKFTLRNWKENIEKAGLLKNRPDRFDRPQTSDLKRYEDELSEKLRKLCGYNGNHCAQYELTRDGQLKLEFSDQEYHFEPKLRDAASSIYRFFREICHVHQHHPRRNDVILDAYEDDGKGSWKSEALYSMMRYAIMAKRDKGVESYFNSIGVTAYAQSFSRSFIDSSSAEDQRTRYNFEELRLSLKAGLETAKWKEGKIPSWFAVASFTFAFLSLLLLVFRTAFGIYQDLSKYSTDMPPLQLAETLEWGLVSALASAFNSNPLSVTLGVGLLAFIPAFVFRKTISFRAGDQTLDFIRLFVARYEAFGFDVSRMVKALILLIMLVVSSTIISTALVWIFDSHDYFTISFPWDFISQIR